jgi:hypothetical protein
MKTFVVEDVLRDYTPGLIVVKAKNKKEALKLIASDQQLSYHDFTDDCGSSDSLCLADKIRELKDNEVVYVYGGG